ncbi:chromate efflux transporter [Candidatus Gottesmanbacteria bacterium]|nr:chromate efflux transporter [Candidatus Gottesmanbacteria bacterium]
MQSKNKSSLKGLIVYFLKLGTIGFGGPIALVGYMQRDLQEKKGWITKEEYLRGLALSQLAPGPLAAQLAMYIGYIRYGIVGITLVALSFIGPSFLMILVISMLYIKFGGLPVMQALFYGIAAAVIGIIIASAYKLTKTTIKDKKFLWVIFGILVLTTAITRQENIYLIVLAGFVSLFIYSRPQFSSSTKLFTLSPILPFISYFTLFNMQLLTKIFFFFALAGAFVFGSGLAIIPFLHGGVVLQNHWLTETQFIDAVAVALITPGPVVITVAFIGFLVSGFWGAVAAGLGVFLPVYLFVVFLAPVFEKYAKNPKLKTFIQGVTAATTGAIAGAIIVLGQQSIKDIPTFLLALGALIGVKKFKIPEPVIIGFAGLLGLLLFRAR